MVGRIQRFIAFQSSGVVLEEPEGRWLRKVRSRMNPRLSQPTSLPVPRWSSN